MSDIFPPAKQREALLALREALGCRDNALRRDECGDWAIFGKHGHIYAVPGTLDRPQTPGFQIFVMGCETVRQWSAVKSATKTFTEITNDGDVDGAFFIARLPTPAEADTIRRYIGIAKKREVSAEELARLAAMGNRFEKRSDVEEGFRGELAGWDGAGATQVAPEPSDRTNADLNGLVEQPK